MFDTEGKNLFHIAAQNGWLNRIPTRLLTERNLQCPSHPEYSTAFYWAALGGYLSQIPKHFLTPPRLNEIDFADRTIFHWAASKGDLELLPSETLIEANLMKPDINGDTPLHCAAFHGHLNQIPSDIKTQKNLMLKTWLGGFTVYHNAAANGNLHQVPLDLLDPSAILEKNNEGRTVLEDSVRHCQLFLIPISTELANRIVEVKAAITEARRLLATDEIHLHRKQDVLRCARAWEVELARRTLRPRGKALVGGAS